MEIRCLRKNMSRYYCPFIYTNRPFEKKKHLNQTFILGFKMLSFGGVQFFDLTQNIQLFFFFLCFKPWSSEKGHRFPRFAPFKKVTIPKNCTLGSVAFEDVTQMFWNFHKLELWSMDGWCLW